MAPGAADRLERAGFHLVVAGLAVAQVGPGQGSHGLPAAVLGRWWVLEMLGLRRVKGALGCGIPPGLGRAGGAPCRRCASGWPPIWRRCCSRWARWAVFARGVSEEYRAGWKTTYTFVNGELLHAIVSVVLAPGAWLLNLPIPDAQHIDRLRMPGGAGEIAEPWIWLYGVSVLAWVAVPRLGLVLLNVLARWRLRRAFPLPLRAAYFITLRAVWRGQKIGVVVVPFRYVLSAEVRARLTALLERIYGLAVDIAIEPPVLMGQDATDWKKALHPEGHVAVVALFPLAATAEADAHGVLLQRLQRSAGRIRPWCRWWTWAASRTRTSSACASAATNGAACWTGWAPSPCSSICSRCAKKTCRPCAKGSTMTTDTAPPHRPASTFRGVPHQRGQDQPGAHLLGQDVGEVEDAPM